MANWFESMQQTYEYYIVDPLTWLDATPIKNIKSSVVDHDAQAITLGSGSIDTEESLGECYIRIYLITVQNGIREKHPLATLLVQTPSTSFDGKKNDNSLDAYTPLLELKENPPPIGYSILEDENIMDWAYRIVREQARAPVVSTLCSEKLYSDFVANTEDTWITFLTDLLENANYEFGIDEMGRILFLPKQDAGSLQPVVTFDDGNSSILLPEFSETHDLYGIPNVVEVIYSSDKANYYSIVVNDDVNSPTSTVNRGRKITHRVINPNLNGNPAQGQIDEYAKQLLRDMSTLERTVTFKHGYYPLRLGDCVRLNYTRAGINNVKAKIISQSIKCATGCTVTTKAVYTEKLWG